MSDDEDDPFERLGDADREGDPFERLDDGPDETTAFDADDEPPGNEADPAMGDPRTDPFADLDPAGTDGNDLAASAESGVDDADPDPFAGMDEPASDPFGDAGSVFEQVDVGSVDDDAVWASITDDDADEEQVVPDDNRRAEVSKHAFCEQCEHFSAPPDAHCTHETAEIIEYLDMERVLLRDCPVVAERQNLE